MTFTHLITIKAQYCIDDRFAQSAYFDELEIERDFNIQYGLADDWFMDFPQPLLNTFDIAYPKLDVDPLEKRPFILFAHGGGFWGGEKEALGYHVTQLAEAGFVAASMNYRKGWLGSGDDCTGDPVSLSVAIYRAMQDIQACLRYITANADTYGIDTAQIYVGGESAGVYALMNGLYMTEEEWSVMHPTHVADHGPLFSSTNNLTNTFTVKGIINMWGGMIDTAYMIDEPMIPMINFYGISDDVIPPTSGPIKYCDGYEVVYGSESMAQVLTNYNVCNVLHQNLFAGHEAYLPEYTSRNIACFVKKQLCESCSTEVINYALPECLVMEQETIAVANFIQESLTVAPNPANSLVSFKLPEAANVNSVISITNVAGSIMDIDYTISGNYVILNVATLPSGIYATTVLGDNSIATGNFVVAH